MDTNINKGVQAMTKDACEARFKKIIDLEYERTILEVEIKVKQATFDKYFSEVAEEKVSV